VSAYLKDVAERVAVTFLEAFVAGIVVTQLTDTGMWAAAGVAGGSAALSLVKSVLASQVGRTDSASLSSSV
jgi:hypothetical protein